VHNHLLIFWLDSLFLDCHQGSIDMLTVSPTAISIGLGFIGLLIVLLFATAMGNTAGVTGFLRKDSNGQCNNNGPQIPSRYKQVNRKSSYTLSLAVPAGPCPPGYTHFTDIWGQAMCCASPNIDIYARTCSAKGSLGVCAMSPGIEDTTGDSGDIRHYPVCQEIANQMQQANSGKLCPMKYPRHASMGAPGHYKCCAGPLAPGGTDCLTGASCAGLVGGQTIFNTPTSCEKSLLLEKIECPPGTNLFENLKGTSARTTGLSMPVCVGVSGNCMPGASLQKLRETGLFTDITIDKNILNCDVYDKVYNQRLLLLSQVETTKSADL
jgi:hypothetical protein